MIWTFVFFTVFIVASCSTTANSITGNKKCLASPEGFRTGKKHPSQATKSYSAMEKKKSPPPKDYIVKKYNARHLHNLPTQKRKNR
ncbi:MAG: hypothetical protein PHU62_03905 [Bacteroidales bacterium]|nr:hypothetical protein [Bacteroidales bacterium]MDD2204748.1 hypothetical protein [Bacteroidales bacterium]MDD3151580.1 hypothetical protein [Bacteroidales bacterium]MDD3914171.1 hypothetical protein [Bacteroidales bacterium]MDD4633706.1 hypothetical protein [Bacteroidales bacterium]